MFPFPHYLLKLSENVCLCKLACDFKACFHHLHWRDFSREPPFYKESLYREEMKEGVKLCFEWLNLEKRKWRQLLINHAILNVLVHNKLQFYIPLRRKCWTLNLQNQQNQIQNFFWTPEEAFCSWKVSDLQTEAALSLIPLCSVDSVRKDVFYNIWNYLGDFIAYGSF